MGRNTVGKGDITCYQQFLLFPHCFQKGCFPGVSKGVIVCGNGLREKNKENKHEEERKQSRNKT